MLPFIAQGVLVLEWALHVGAGDGDPALALWLERPT
jgi:hypothetical protein